MSRIQTGDFLTDFQDNVDHAIKDKPFADLGAFINAVDTRANATLLDATPEELTRLQNRMRESSTDLEAFNDQLFRDAPTDVSKLRRYNQIRRANKLQEKGLLPPEQDFGAALEQIGEDITDGYATPFVGGFIEAKDVFEVLEASEDAEAGKATIDQWGLLADFQEDMARRARGSTLGADIASGVAGSTTFAAEYALSGGAFPVAKKLLLKGGGRAAKKAASATISSVIKKAMAGAAVRTPLFAPRIAANAVQRMIPGFRVDPGDNEPFRIVVGNRGESPGKAIANASLDTVIELFSEGTGEVVAIVARPLKRVAGKIVGEKIANFRMPAREFLEKMGYSTFPGELAEERIGATLRTAATELSKASGFDVINLPDNIIPTAREFATEAGVLATIGGGGSVLGRALGGKPSGPQSPVAPEEGPPAPPRTPESDQSFAEEIAQIFTTINPEGVDTILEAADRLASGTPSAKTFEGVGLPAVTRSVRNRIVEQLRSIRAAAVAEAARPPIDQIEQDDGSETQRRRDEAEQPDVSQPAPTGEAQTEQAAPEPSKPKKPAKKRVTVSAARKEVEAIFNRHRSEIEPESLVDVDSPEQEAQRRSGYIFKDDKHGRSDRDELRALLDEDFHRHVTVVTRKGARPDGSDVASEIGFAAMAEAIIEAHTGKKGSRADRTAKFVLENHEQFDPSEVLAVTNYLQLREGEGNEQVKAGTLNVGDTLELRGEKHEVTEKDADGTIVLANGITFPIAPDATINVDDNSVKKPVQGREIPNDLLGNPLIEPSTGANASFDFGENVEGRQDAEEAAIEAEVADGQQLIPPGEPVGPLEDQEAAGTTDESLNELKVIGEHKAAGKDVDAELKAYGKGKKARQDLLDSLDDFGKLLDGKTFANPLDPEILLAIAKTAKAAIKAGVFSFEDFVRHLVGKIGYDRVQRLGPAIEQEWDKASKDNPSAPPSLSVDSVLASIVDLSTVPTPLHEATAQSPTVPPSDPIDDATTTMEPGDRLPEIIEQWHADRDESHTVINLDARTREAEMVELSGAKRATSKAHRDLAQAMHLHIDLLNAEERGLGTPAEQFELFKGKLTPEQIESYERSQSLSPAELAMAERFIAENNQLGIDAQDASVISNHYENYTARLLNPPADATKAGRTLVGKFTLKSPRAKKRSLDSILHAWALGYTLRVPDVTGAQRVARESIAQVIHDRNMLAAALKAQIFSTRQIDDTWVRVEHPNMKTWRMVGLADVIDVDAPLETGAWVALPDRGVIGEVRLVSESQNAVFVKVPGEADLVPYRHDDLERRVVKNFGGKNTFLNPLGQLFERQEIYAPKKVARHLNNALGRSPLNDIALAKGLSEWNDILKHTLLTTSLFHHQAFLRSYLLAGRVSVRTAIAEIMRGIYGAAKYLIRGNPFLFPARLVNPFGLARGFARQLSGFRAGQAAMDGFTPQLRELVRAGLTIGRQQEWDAAALERKTLIGKTIDRVPGAREVKDKLIELRDVETDFLFSELGPALKVRTALIEYVDLLGRNDAALRKGEVTREELASLAANLANDDFGGLHLQRKGRNPLGQQIFRFLMLAPDWTESNVASMRKAFKGGREGEVYRAMWGRVALKGLTATFMSTLALALIPVGDDDDDRSTIQRFFDSFKRAWAQGNLRWLDIDVTPLYQKLGGSKEKKKYFSLIGHFRDVIKFFVHPVKSAKHKGSVMSRMVFSALTGEDWAGRAFTSLSELLGVDDKGQYKTKTATHDIGDPKGGKLRGRLVAKQIGGRPLDYTNLPSFVAHEARGTAPIQVQQAMQFLAGEADAYDAITKAIGLMTATTYPPTDPKKSIAEAAEFGDKVQARAALKRLEKEQGANEARKFVGGLIDKATRPPTKTTVPSPEALAALKTLDLDQKQIMGDFRFYWLTRKRKVGTSKYYGRLVKLKRLTEKPKKKKQ